MFLQPGMGLEFFDRVMNLCEYQFPMSPALRTELTYRFGQEILGIIEQYNDKESVKLTQGLRTKIMNGSIPPNLKLEFIRLFDCPCCPASLGVYTTTPLPDGNVVGDIIMYADFNIENHREFYWWNGEAWVLAINFDVLNESPFTDASVDVTISDSDYEYSVDEGATWNGLTSLEGGVDTINIWMRKVGTSCIYVNDPVTYIPSACPVDFGVFASKDDFPAVAEVGDMAMEANSDGTFIYRSLYTFDGVGWMSVNDMQALNDTTFTNATVNFVINDVAYEYSVDSGSTWNSTDPISTPVAQFGVLYRIVGTECEYQNTAVEFVP